MRGAHERSILASKALALAALLTVACSGDEAAGPESGDSGAAGHPVSSVGPNEAALDSESPSEGAVQGQEPGAPEVDPHAGHDHGPVRPDLGGTPTRAPGEGIDLLDLPGVSSEGEAATLKVVVLREEDEQPVPGVKVRLMWRGEGSAAGRDFRVTDASGLAVFETLAGVYVQSVYAEPTAWTAPVGLPIKAPIQAGEAELVLRVAKGSIVSGRVLDELGEPMVGVKVRAWFKDRWEVENDSTVSADVRTFTDELGIFTLGGFPRGDFLLDAELDGKASMRRLGGRLRTGQILDEVELIMTAAQPVFGMVADTEGTPVVGAQIVAGPVGRFANREPVGVPNIYYYPSKQHALLTGEGGLFEIPAVPSDQVWVVEVKHLDFRPNRTRILPGQTSVDITVERGLDLIGRVFDADGLPLRGAVLHLRGEQNVDRRSGKNGGFRFQGLDEEVDAALLVYAPGHAPELVWPITIGPDLQPVELHLVRGRSLAGRVVDGSGAGLARVRIEAVGPTPTSEAALVEYSAKLPEEEFGLGSTLTSEDGTFLLSDLYEGEFILRVYRPDGAGVAWEDKVAAGSDPLTIPLPL